MHAHAPPLGLVDVVSPFLVALVLVALASLLREPTKQRFNAIFVAGAGAAYFDGGLGPWELAFTALATYVAYRGLTSYRFIALAWLMHTAWDVVHHFYGRPILAFAPTSSAGCAITDALLAAWFFYGAPPIARVVQGRWLER